MVKPGYKQTEIGEIPEDWEVATLCEAYDLSAGGDLNTSDYSPVKTKEYNYCILSNSLANAGIYGYCSKPQFVGNSITITGRGDIGHSLYRAEPFSAIIRLLVCQPKSAISSKIITEYLEIKKPFVFESTGVPQLTVPQIKNTKIPVPPLFEQERIAEALSDMDELIASLEKLIVKKKAIKQGAMQELLTGKRRLPGFSGEWESKAFGDLFLILPNNSFSREQLSLEGKIKNIHYGDILTKYGAYLDGSSSGIPTLGKELEEKSFSEKSFVQNGDVIIADTAEDLTVGKAVEMLNVSVKVLSGQHTFLCRPGIPFASMYLGYYLNSADFHDQIIPFVTGIKVSSINKTALCGLTVRYPGLVEQRVIAEILSDMDNNISILEQRLRKARQLKQGMMQQLLTGKIRLV